MDDNFSDHQKKILLINKFFRNHPKYFSKKYNIQKKRIIIEIITK
jgi:hypothetical protein